MPRRKRREFTDEIRQQMLTVQKYDSQRRQTVYLILIRNTSKSYHKLSQLQTQTKKTLYAMRKVPFYLRSAAI